MTDERGPEPRGRGSGPRLNRKAVLSVLFGASAFLLSFLSGFGAFALAVPALTTGIHARREIAGGHGEETGDLTAVAGLTMGATTLVLLAVSWALSSGS